MVPPFHCGLFFFRPEKWAGILPLAVQGLVYIQKRWESSRSRYQPESEAGWSGVASPCPGEVRAECPTLSLEDFCHARGGSPPREEEPSRFPPHFRASTTCTCGYLRMTSSAVTSAAPSIRAVASRSRSAGSLWNPPGRE